MERQVMGITWLNPPFNGGFFMACSSTRQTCLESLCIQGARLHSGAEPKVHNFVH